MLRSLQQRDTKVKILLWVVVLAVGGMMVITLVPLGGGSLEGVPDLVADVDGQAVTTFDVQRQLQRIERLQPIPQALRSFYTRQIVDSLIFERLLESEARRLGIRVTDAEQVERIKLLLPTVFAGDTFLGRDRYALELQQRFGPEMTIGEFEALIHKGLLEEKFRRLVTDGVTVSPAEVEAEFRRRNEKVKIEYVVADAAQLESRVQISDADLAAFYEKNKAKYQLPERRTIRYILLNLFELGQRVPVTDDELRAYYNEHIDLYRVQNRARVSHILLKTVGKTDAEIEETRKKAEDILKKARAPKAKFEDLAKEYSEDTTKASGGDLGWIVPGQTVAPFEQAAFSLPVGSVSDIVKTEYGFHILLVRERESARTKPFEEVRASILPIVTQEKGERVASSLADKLGEAVRQSTRRSLDEVAKQFGLTVREAGPMAMGDPIPALGAAPGIQEEIFRLRKDELSQPIRLDQGYAVVNIKEIQPARQGTLIDVRDKASADFRREKGLELARDRAAELAKRAKSLESLAQAARALSLEAKTSDLFARTGSVAGVGSGRQLGDAFSMAVNAVSAPVAVGGNWVVYRVVERQDVNPADLEKERKSLTEQLLNSKQSSVYEAFRSALDERMRREGKLRINAENYRRLTTAS
jgi:peptidyl-prolyl cis-trans isomerase D